ncbi:MAG: T9SS type A sorting domain-containing protein, partial [Bacteroidota bacterium]
FYQRKGWGTKVGYEGDRGTVNFSLFSANDVGEDAVITDRLGVLETSFPAPDQVEWVFDETRARIVEQDENIYYFTFDEPDTYDLSLIASFGGCEDIVTKRVTIHTDRTTIPSPVVGASNILDLTIAPNPTTGRFTVTARLASALAATFTLFDSNGMIADRRQTQNELNPAVDFDVSGRPGTFFLQLQVGEDSRVMVVVVQ